MNEHNSGLSNGFDSSEIATSEESHNHALDWSKDVIQFLNIDAEKQKNGSSFYSTFSRGLSMFSKHFQLPWANGDVKEDLSLLEFGAGAGEVAAELAKEGIQNTYTGVSIENLQSNEFKALDGATYLVEPFHTYLLRNKNQSELFDWIGSSHALEYFPAAVEAFLASYRLLKVGGVFQSCDGRVQNSKRFMPNPLGIQTMYEYFTWLKEKLDSNLVEITLDSSNKQFLEIKKISQEAPASLPFPFRAVIQHREGITLSLAGRTLHFRSKKKLVYQYVG